MVKFWRKMNDILAFWAFVLLQTSFTSSMFYHEQSRVVFYPNENLPTSDFGFSIGYQEEINELIVGSPHADQVGRVYRCQIDSTLSNRTCENIIVDAKKIALDFDPENNNQNFCLGASIAVTSKYFVTCAPLWTKTDIKDTHTDVKGYTGSYGTCFIYSHTAHRFNGIVEQVKNGEKTTDGKYLYEAIYGGLGWSLLADEKNELLLLAKPFDVGDIQYVNSTGLEKDQKRGSASLYFSDLKQTFIDVLEPDQLSSTNIGYALAEGKFFDVNYTNTMYAFSIKKTNDLWAIQFLYLEENRTMNIARHSKKMLLEITSGDADEMFGAAMSSVDINADGLTDLLVGAPAHSQAGRCETGALYIYLGGKIKEYIKRRSYKIVSDKQHSRFGSAIVTTDLDGDSLPEIVVSAPYENFGAGAVYIISGYELNRTMILKRDADKDIDGIVLFKLENFKFAQKIENKEFKSFGFSLQVIRDIDENGCDELVLGSPRNASVTVIRCVPTITASISVKRLTEVVKTTDSSFTVEVCVKVTYQDKPKAISTKLQVVNEVKGKGAQLLSNEKFKVELAERRSLFCQNITVELREGERDTYFFKTKLEHENEALFNNSVYVPTLVRMSVYSQLEASTTVKRTCAGADCDPKLSMEILWDGSKNPKMFHIKEKTDKGVTLVIRNEGANAYEACVNIKITGAKGRLNCISFGKPGEYQCHLPKPIATHKTHNLNFVVVIDKATNVNNQVNIKADLYNVCESGNSNSKELDVKYTFSMKNIFISEGSHNVTVTDSEIKNLKKPTLIDKHEYQITNKGGLEWENVYAIVNVRKRSFFESLHILIKEIDVDKGCDQKNDTSDGVYMTFVCSGMKLFDNPISINVLTEIPYAKIMENLVDGELEIESNIEVRMASSNDSIRFPKRNQTTKIIYLKETSFANDKTAIIITVVIVAIIILVIVTLILYKVGFFQRKQKKRLDSYKESIRSKSRSAGEPVLLEIIIDFVDRINSSKPSTSGAGEMKPDSKEDSLEDFEIEVIDDCAFESIPTTTADDVALIGEDKNKDVPLEVIDKKESVAKGSRQDRQSTKM